MTSSKTDTKYSSPLKRQTLTNKSAKAPEVPPLTDDAAAPKGCTSEALSIIKSFDFYDFARVCSTPIRDLGIVNPEDSWAKDYTDLSNRMKEELISKDGNVKEFYISVGNEIQNSTQIMTPELLALAICKVAGWKAFLRGVNGKAD